MISYKGTKTIKLLLLGGSVLISSKLNCICTNYIYIENSNKLQTDILFMCIAAYVRGQTGMDDEDIERLVWKIGAQERWFLKKRQERQGNM